MRIISHKKLKIFYEQSQNADARVPPERWYEVASMNGWHSLADIRQDFGDADMVGNQHHWLLALKNAMA